MKRIVFFVITVIGLPLVVLLTSFGPPLDQYIIITWNDLGMHCSGMDYQNLCILPPYNNLKGHVILRGNATTLPQVVTSGVAVTYEIPGNTYSVGKTNFWTYVNQLFGVTLPPNIGLTGVGLTGSFLVDSNAFYVEGIPITPYTDINLVTEDPYQLGLITAFDQSNNILAISQPVIPVSNEMNCVSSGCHSSETDILFEHDAEGGFDPYDTPILCANCHSDNALGMPGTPGLPSLSEVMHSKHGEYTDDCYKCHPGPNTQCFRDIMYSGGMVCQDCHGSVSEVGQSISDGRIPWFEEPSCGAVNCHGPNFAEEPGKLFRNSRGHGNLYCSTCHGSPHAILPTVNDRDNVQNIALQDYAGTLSDCSVCHGVNPSGPGPHGLLASVPDNLIIQNDIITSGHSECYNATQTITVAGDGSTYIVQNGGDATLVAGQNIRFLPGTDIQLGGHLHGYITTTGNYCGNLESAIVSNPPPQEPAKTAAEPPKSGFKIYPNPTTGTFTLLLSEPLGDVPCYFQVTGMLGNQIISEKLEDSNRFVFDLSTQNRGIYIVRLIRGERVDADKVIKQ